jgi:hypothetical protein
LRDEDEMVRGFAVRRPEAVELSEVPVCARCDDMLVETGAYRDEVELFLGRTNVSRHDDGLSDARWERLKASGNDDGYDKHPMWHSSRARRNHRSSERRSKSESRVSISVTRQEKTE